MTVYVKKIQNNNRKNQKAYGKWYGRTVALREVGIEELANDIQENCTAKRSDVLAVLSELGPAIKKQMHNSFKVRIPYLGVFKMGIASEGVEKPEDYDVRLHVKNLHVLFQPEYTIELGRAVKDFTSGTKLALFPANGIVGIGTDQEQDPENPGQGGSVVEDEP